VNKKYTLILMSYWRTAVDWFVTELRRRNVQKIAYIVNAERQKFRDVPDFVLYDRDALVQAGFEVDVMDLEAAENLEERLSRADLIYVRGGNTFDLLDSARNSGFDKLSPTLLKQGKIYAGSSAGSILVAPSIEITENDFMPDCNNAGLTDKAGLNLIDTAVFPHYLDEYKEKLDKLISDLGITYPVTRLHDNEVLVLENGTEKIIDITEAAK